jgi:hypothetical protein
VQPDLPASRWTDDPSGAAVARLIDPSLPLVIACKAGHNRSQRTAAELRAMGIGAQVLEGGSLAFAAAGHPVLPRASADRWGGTGRVWVTRRRPKIDRIACPWLIRRFIDPAASFLVDADQVLAAAADVGGKLTRPARRSSMTGRGAPSTLLEVKTLPAAPVAARHDVRAADTDDLAASPQAYLAVSLGLSALPCDDDAQMLCHGFVIPMGFARGDTGPSIPRWTHRT